MAGKKKGPTKAVAKKSIKLKIDNELLDTLTKSSEVTQYVYNLINLHYYSYT
jgi:hypothetical protein